MAVTDDTVTVQLQNWHLVPALNFYFLGLNRLAAP